MTTGPELAVDPAAVLHALAEPRRIELLRLLTDEQAHALRERVTVRCGAAVAPPEWAEPDGRTKVSAAWLIERAGFARGDGDPDGIAISTKHVLALTNRGDGTAEDLVAFARRIAHAVRERFGVELVPEPVFVNLPWP